MPIRKLASLALGALLVAAPSLSLHAETATPQSVGLSSERLARVHELVERTIAAGEIAGAVTLVARNGQIAYLEAQGVMDLTTKRPMQPDTMFRLASMSKPVAAVAILMLAEEGKVRLNDPVSRFIPAYANLEVGVLKPATPSPGGPPPAAPAAGPGGPPPSFYTVPATRQITVLDLLTHTSGLMSGPMGNSVANAAFNKRHDIGVRWTEELAASPLEFQPGARWAYSAVGGFDLLARIVEIASGQEYNAFLSQRLFGPLGMRDATFWPSTEQRSRLATVYQRRGGALVASDNPDSMSGQRYRGGGGGLMATAETYAQFAMMLANGGELHGVRILSPRSVEFMGSAFIPSTLPGRPAGEGFGLGVRVVTDAAARGTWLSEGSFGWSGVYGTHFWADPKEDLVGILLAQTANRTFSSDFENAVMQALLDPND
ncbi:MAG TPA: serine hydrolase domain-containing protein [Gammaproteobacteria bacterium]|nr:serine hydrolase domain-containing protein [Gammaproteobacteria bacterium]